ncbi:ATP-binding protein [Amycolatopsis sp. NPDC003865]
MSGAERRRHAPLTWTIAPESTAAETMRSVRAWIADHLGEVAGAHRRGVIIVATELVTNAYGHAGGAATLRMSHDAVGCRVRIEVDDRSVVRPVIVPPQLGQRGGRGMLVVRSLSEAWGVFDDPVACTKTVWAEVSCGGEDRLPCPSGVRTPAGKRHQPNKPHSSPDRCVGRHRAKPQ